MEVKTKKVKLASIKLNEENPRTITDAELSKLKKSLKEFPEMMDLREIVVDENMTILGGNMRYYALMQAGESECRVKICQGLTPEQKREFIIKDNANFGDWDWDILANNWSDLPLDEWGLNVPDKPPLDDDNITEDNFDADAEAEKIEEPITKPGDVWLLGEHRLICGDSTDEEVIRKLMGGKMADMIWTDPPYGVDYAEKNEFINKKVNKVKKAEKHKDIVNDDLRKEPLSIFLLKALTSAGQHIRKGGCIYVSHADVNTIEFRESLKGADFHISQTLIWVKNSAVMGRNDYNWRHEPILYGWKEGAAHFFCLDYSQNTVIDDQEDPDEMLKEDLVALVKDLRDMVAESAIRVNRPTKADLHPTMKPIKLIAKMIRNSTDYTKKERVLDMFGGSGSTLMAAEQTNRVAYLCELDPKYCDVIKMRWEQFTGGQGELLEIKKKPKHKKKDAAGK